MDKMAIYQYLKEQKIKHEVTEHKDVYDMKALNSIELPYPEWIAKNLFVRDDKRKNYYLITVKGNKRGDLKEFRRQHGLRALSFASAEDLYAVLGVAPGAVSPFGILNDTECKVMFYIDDEFAGNKIGVHPNDNTATVWVLADDLVRLIQNSGNDAEYTQI